MSVEQLTVMLLGREYRLACRPEEKGELMHCARYVEKKMNAIQAEGKVIGQDRIATLVALQLAQELMSIRNADGVPLTEVKRRLSELNTMADNILAPQGNLFP